MKSFLRIFFITILFFGFTNLFAQESDAKDHPGWLVLSQQMVDMEDMPMINKMVDSVFAPILNEMVSAGKLAAWGQLNHAWGDEWNFNIYYVTKDHKSFVEFWGEYVSTMRERHPDAFGQMTELMDAHKDNMYSIRTMNSYLMQKSK